MNSFNLSAAKNYQQDPRSNAPTSFNIPDTTLEVPVEQIIHSWLVEKNKFTVTTSNNLKPNPRTRLSISLAKKQLKYCLDLVQKLNDAQEDLRDNVDKLSTNDWKQKTNDIGLLKDEFNQMIAKFEDANTIKGLKKHLTKRQKKRQRDKNRKISRRQDYANHLEKRQKLHKKIDQWLESKKHEVEKAKLEEKFKKDADCILSEVTKKKSDARKQLSLISALVKLRTVRENMATQRGEKTSAEDRLAFGSVTEKLIRMWEHVLQQYTQEEQNLKMKLEENHSEDTRTAQVAKEEEWRGVLFGQNDPNQLSNLYWALTSAERDMETFIAIRKSWDTFLVESTGSIGSCIPIGWVIPREDTEERWKVYIKR